MKRKSSLFGIFALSALGIGVVFSYTTKALIKVALERDGAKKFEAIPFLKKRVGGFLPPKTFLQDLLKAEQELRQCPTQEICIRSHDGINLVGHWYPAKNPKRILIAMHGWRTNWARDFGLIAPFWHQSDCSILFAEQRGQGKSGGAHMGFGLTERLDCLSWIRWINNCIGRKPLYLMGVSMGATSVLMASGLGLPDNVKGIVADCGFTSPHAIWKHVAERNLHLSYRLRRLSAEKMCKRTLQMGTNDFSTLDALSQSSIPTLLIHGKKDHFVPPQMTLENYKVCTAPKRLLLVPDADHGMSYYIAPHRYQKKLTDFFQEFDYFKYY